MQACEVSSEPKTATLDGVLALRLRAAIHLNIALCSLKREDWYLARKASLAPHLFSYAAAHFPPQ